MKFEYKCPFNLASIIVEELEDNSNIDFLTVNRPHFLFSNKNDATIIIDCKNENIMRKILKKTLKTIHEKLTTLETIFQNESSHFV